MSFSRASPSTLVPAGSYRGKVKSQSTASTWRVVYEGNPMFAQGGTCKPRILESLEGTTCQKGSPNILWPLRYSTCPPNFLWPIRYGTCQVTPLDQWCPLTTDSRVLGLPHYKVLSIPAERTWPENSSHTCKFSCFILKTCICHNVSYLVLETGIEDNSMYIIMSFTHLFICIIKTSYCTFISLAKSLEDAHNFKVETSLYVNLFDLIKILKNITEYDIKT